jgi:hypothetical protein
LHFTAVAAAYADASLRGFARNYYEAALIFLNREMLLTFTEEKIKFRLV